jgi:hypothetical protein
MSPVVAARCEHFALALLRCNFAGLSFNGTALIRVIDMWSMLECMLDNSHLWYQI